MLTADLRERPGSWKLVTTIPFGERTEELGLITDVHRTSLPELPRSFAIAGDGSVWILDVVKKRVAHYSRTGAFLGEILGFRIDRFHPQPRDVVFSNGRMYVLEQFMLKATVVAVDPDGRLRRASAVVDGVPVGLDLMYPATGGVAGFLIDRIPPRGGSPRDVVLLDAFGNGWFLPGVPVASGRWVDLQTPSDQEMEFRFTTSESVAVQPVLVRALTRTGQAGVDVPLVIGPSAEAAVDGGLSLVVRISPARPRDAERYGGGPWLLQMGADTGPLVWERLPQAGISDEEQARHLCAGPDGHLYLMVPTKEGEAIYMK